VLGRRRRKGRLGIPVVSFLTDIGVQKERRVRGQASQRHHAVFIAQTNVTSLVYKVEMAVSRVLIVACCV